MRDLKEALAHVRWIGGATDAGKTTVAYIISESHDLQLYNYDRSDTRHQTLLAQVWPECAAFLAQTFDERWVHTTPEALLDYTFRVFRNRWPLVLENILALPTETLIIVEGFGLTPALLAPLLTDPRHAIWLLPTRQFKLDSMERRDKPVWRFETRDPERARQNLLGRDMLLAEWLRTEVAAHGFTAQEVDGSRSAAEMVALVEGHFGL